MGMANLQRMAMQMQQEMARVQQELAETNVEVSSLPAGDDSNKLLTEFNRIFNDDAGDVKEVE